MGKPNLILITNFAVAKMASEQSQFFPRSKNAQTASYDFLAVFIAGYVFRLFGKSVIRPLKINVKRDNLNKDH